MVKFPVHNLVFEGGGVKGIAYAGVLEALEERFQMQEVRRVAGTSVGAVTAALVALSARAHEIREAIAGINLRTFADDTPGILRDIRRLIKQFGWNRGDSFTEWFRNQMREIAGNSDFTFSDVRRLAEKYHGDFFDLYVIGTNLSRQEAKVFSARHTPDLPVWQAVRISIGIPLFFAAVKMDGDWWVDGGLTWNYPIDLFDTFSEGHTRVNQRTIGFRVGSDVPSVFEHPIHEIDNLCDYGLVLAGFWQEAANRAHLRAEDWDRTVFIDAEGVRAMDFGLSPSAVDNLVKNGKRATILALSRMNHSH